MAALSYKKLSEYERSAYNRLAKAFFTSEAIDDRWRENIAYRELKTEALQSLFDMVWLAKKMSRISWYGVKQTVTTFQRLAGDRTIEELPYGPPVYSGYFYCMQNLLERHNCDRVNWSTFPAPPWRIDFRQPDKDHALLRRLDEMRQEGTLPPENFFV